MFRGIQFLLKKILSVFAVTGNKPTVEHIKGTSQPDGAAFRVTDASGETSRDVFVTFNTEADAYDLTATGYVTVAFDEKNIQRGRPAVRFTRIDKVLSEEDHEALVGYFKDKKIIRLYASPPHDTGKATAPTPLKPIEHKL